ncbi:Ribosomal RNA small subunit methyltransferase F [invertebrate metagenome]|uniref:Ribosomal RNA small subunit methyltransferase F n=1 Tax=invertebrate metagenome TaxID=1711999 RepID=A0A2H9TCM9_9ZZZZ
MSYSLKPLPTIFSERMVQIMGEECFASILSFFSRIRPTVFRVNPLKIKTQALVDELQAEGFDLSAVQGFDGVFRVPEEQRRLLTESPAFHEGRLYIQNLSSMLAPRLLAPKPDETVLDLAAAPGGKTLQLAAMMQNQGQLSAVESVKSRFFKLRANLESQGVTCVRTFLMDGRAVGNKCPERFDRVLLDAPCSSEARFNQLNPDSWSHWSLKKVSECARKQRRLLLSALHSLKPGGVMIYCTCSYAPEENELVIAHALKRLGNKLSVEAVDTGIENTMDGITCWQGKPLDHSLSQCRRILPSPLMDGFFLCKVKKLASFS